MLATKIFKNQGEGYLFLPKKNAVGCIWVGKTK